MTTWVTLSAWAMLENDATLFFLLSFIIRFSQHKAQSELLRQWLTKNLYKGSFIYCLPKALVTRTNYNMKGNKDHLVLFSKRFTYWLKQPWQKVALGPSIHSWLSQESTQVGGAVRTFWEQPWMPGKKRLPRLGLETKKVISPLISSTPSGVFSLEMTAWRILVLCNIILSPPEIHSDYTA